MRCILDREDRVDTMKKIEMDLRWMQGDPSSLILRYDLAKAASDVEG